MVFLPHTNTVILLEPYCGTITEPGLPVVKPLLRGPPIKRKPCRVPKLTSYISLYNEPLFSERGH